MKADKVSDIGRRHFAADHGHGGKDHGHGDHGHGHGDDHGHGHDDHHHHEPITVPHYSKYNNWAVAPELVAHQARLNVIGLKDPWIRQYVFLYHPNARKHWGYSKLGKAVFGGFKYGIYAAVPLIALTEAWIYYKKRTASEDGHNDGHH